MPPSGGRRRDDVNRRRGRGEAPSSFYQYTLGSVPDIFGWKTWRCPWSRHVITITALSSETGTVGLSAVVGLKALDSRNRAASTRVVATLTHETLRLEREFDFVRCFNQQKRPLVFASGLSIEGGGSNDERRRWLLFFHYRLTKALDCFQAVQQTL